VVVLRCDAAEPDGLPDQHGDAFGLHLLHDLGAVAFDGAGTELEPGRDGVTGEAGRDQIEDLDLARRQRGELAGQDLA
jgi:hypothetical protein